MDLQAEIVPARSAAGFVVGQRYSPSVFGDVPLWDRSHAPLEQAIAATDGWLRVELSQLSLDTPDGYMLHGHHGAVELKLTSEDLLYSIGVFAGYQGRYAKSIGVGDKLASVVQHMPLFFDPGDEVHYPASGGGVHGIAFLAGSVPLDEDPDQVVLGIIVYDWEVQRPSS